MIKTLIAGAIASIRFSHFRAAEGSEVSTHGGATLAVTTTTYKDEPYVLAAVAYCHPNDKFSRPEGRRKAEARLKWLGQQLSVENNVINEVTFDGKIRYFVMPGTPEELVPEVLVSVAEEGGYVRPH